MDKNANLEELDPEDFRKSLKNALAKDDTEDTELDLEEEVSGDSEEESDEDSELGLDEDNEDIDADLPDDDSDEPENDDDVPPIVAKKVSSKEAGKITALKRELKEAKEKLTKAEAKQKAEADEQQLTALVSKYSDAGYDEDTAKQWAKTEFEMQDIKKQLAASNFKAENAELFEHYPEAKGNVHEILKKMEVTGFTAKQICRALYEEDTNPVKERAKKAVSGTLERTSNNSVSNATRSAGNPSTTTLTQAQKIGKRELMMAFPSLRGMSDKEYLNSIK